MEPTPNPAPAFPINRTCQWPFPVRHHEQTGPSAATSNHYTDGYSPDMTPMNLNQSTTQGHHKPVTRFFLDTEFIESGPSRPIELISIGIASERGERFYEISSEFNAGRASEWVQTNVLAKLGPIEKRFALPLDRIAERVKLFIGDAMPEFWGYYCAYDWVLFCMIFGSMLDLPKGYPKYCHDIKQLCDANGNPTLPVKPVGAHNALTDALWNRDAWHYLNNVSRPRLPYPNGRNEDGPDSWEYWLSHPDRHTRARCLSMHGNEQCQKFLGHYPFTPHQEGNEVWNHA